MTAGPAADAAETLCRLATLVQAQKAALDRVTPDRPVPADVLALLRTTVPGTYGLAERLDTAGLVRLAEVTATLTALRQELVRRQRNVADRSLALRRARRGATSAHRLDISA